MHSRGKIRAPVKRLARITLNAVTVLSLILFTATVALWVRSYWCECAFGWLEVVRPDEERRVLVLDSGRGGAAIVIGSLSPAYARSLGPERWQWRGYGPPIRYARYWSANRYGFGYECANDPNEWRYRTLIFPLWLATIGFALFPVTRPALVIRRRRRGREGHCPQCGYDLRATADRCPECRNNPRP
jgi:hypothetical protein